MPVTSLARRAPKRAVRGNAYRRQGPRFTLKIDGIRRFCAKCFGLLMIFVLVLGVSYSMLAGYRVLTNHPYFGLQHMDVKGNQHLDYGQLLERAGVELGQNTLSLNVKEIQKRLAEEPWIDRVAVKRVIPGTLAVRITEKQPAFLLQDGKTLFYAESNGTPIGPVDPGRFLSLPVLRIKPGADTSNLPGLVTLLEQKRFPFSMAEISWAAVTAGDEAQLYLGKRKILLSVGLGSLQGDAQKINLVWKDLNRRNDLGLVESIAVFRDKVFVRMQDNGSPVVS